MIIVYCYEYYHKNIPLTLIKHHLSLSLSLSVYASDVNIGICSLYNVRTYTCTTLVCCRLRQAPANSGSAPRSSMPTPWRQSSRILAFSASSEWYQHKEALHSSIWRAQNEISKICMCETTSIEITWSVCLSVMPVSAYTPTLFFVLFFICGAYL